MLQKDLFLIDVLDSALQSDARAASQPLSIKAEETADIEEGFGTLVYDKGASLIYMIAALMGEEKFKKGLQVGQQRQLLCCYVRVDFPSS